VPVEIAQVTAGSNKEQAGLTLDDDETTSWRSDGAAGTGWIRYEFAKPTTVSEVTLKLGGWRNRSYPVRIRVGDRVVYQGNTPRSLGYVTLSFKPTAGQNLTIELSGAATDGDTFGQLVEVTGATGTGSAGETAPPVKGTLQILEMEIYQGKK
jgi:hypothetical protein